MTEPRRWVDSLPVSTAILRALLRAPRDTPNDAEQA